ncbi:uncharacterized protein LOC130675117 [Microplitis mediator]|uniref:uncharacterized protein LOC130675117 n=1 Tax=Microplitis mediator TaxID=375433 RepID=UPI0025540003|nr:uncharacterized protein LOC130675117 [Microplitis mediator]XP_057336595.1 uncharacterized protein LOC130675117 [Microplitis mediator]
MAEKLSPCLSGIQKVAGSKLSDKLSTLNRIAIKIVDSENQNEAMQLAVDSSELPEVLKPLVQVEVARLSEQFEGICEALKSDDSVVFDRALRAKWFFNGSHENCRVQFYKAQIFPVVSLHSRLKIIKALANNLTANPIIAEEFYTALTLMYGEKQAHPLLMACSESFIRDRIEKHKLQLNNRLVRNLFYKYPGLIVKYLKLPRKSDDKYERNSQLIYLRFLREFLPRLVKKCPDAFVELVEMHHHGFFIGLSHTRTELFLKSSIDSFMKKPKFYLQILDLKTVTKSLTDSQFRSVIKQLFPPRFECFQFDSLEKYLSYLPKEKVLPLVNSIFQEVYKINFLYCNHKITPTAMQFLSQDERTRQARMKLKTEPTDYFNYSTRSWVCYFPCDESVSLLKDIIKRTPNGAQRCELLKQLIFTCVINSDNNALLGVLKYILTNHKNEGRFTLVNVLQILSQEFDLKTLTREHWDVIDSLLKLVYAQNGIDSNFITIFNLITGKIGIDLANNCSITDKIRMLAESNVTYGANACNILKDNLAYNRKCLEELIRVFPSVNKRRKKSITIDLIGNVLSSIYDFNKRNSEAKSPLEMMSIKNYPWLYNSVKMFIKNEDQNKKDVKRLKELLRDGETEIFDALVTADERIDVQSPKVLKLLKNHPEKILKDWELYLEKCMENIRNPWARKFLKLCRWYQKLPIKFADKSLNEVVENKREGGLIVLGLLFEGPALEQVVNVFVPTSTTIDSDEEDAADDCKMSFTTPKAFNAINPPVSLDFILDVCERCSNHVIISSLVDVSRRTALPKVISFAQTLMDRPVSIKKLGIRLFCMVADVKKLRGLLIKLWKSETDRTIRAFIFKNVFEFFKSIPNDDTWGMICECFDGLKPEDEDMFESLMNLKSIPNEYITDYVHILFSLFRRLGDEENGLKPDVVWSHTEKLLNVDKNILVLYSDELHNAIIDKYVLDLSLPQKIQSAGHMYLINYIRTAGEKLEDRLKRFKNVFIKIVRENWNNPHPTISSFYPAKYFVKNLTEYLINSVNKSHEPSRVRLIEVAFESFNSTLRPQQNPHFYMNISFASVLSANKFTPKGVAWKVSGLLPGLINIFSAELMPTIASFLFDYLMSYFSDEGTDCLLDVVECLIGLNNDPATILAAHLLSLQKYGTYRPRFIRIVNFLTEHNNPVVMAIASIIMYKLL